MNVLYSVGSVKQKLSRFYSRDCSRFIWVYVKLDEVYLAEISKLDENKWQISNFEYAVKQNECDEYFYQEELYKYCRSIYDLKYLVITFAKDVGVEREYEFPQMPIKDVVKALSWELKADEDVKDFDYVYSINNEGNDFNIVVYLMSKDMIKSWQNIAKEQDLIILSMNKSNKSDISIEKVNENSWHFESTEKIFCDLQIDRELVENTPNCLLISEDLAEFLLHEYGELLNYKQIPSKWQWRKIFTVIFTLLMSFTIIIGSFWYVKYQQAWQQEQKISEHLALIQSDLDNINELKYKEQLIAEKQNLIQILENKSINLYAILVNLGVYTVENVALTDMEVKAQDILLTGIAKDYESVSKYNAQLAELKFIHNTQIKDIKLDEQTGLWHFTINLK